MAVLSQYKQYGHFCRGMTWKLVSDLMLRVPGGLCQFTAAKATVNLQIAKNNLQGFGFFVKKMLEYYFIQCLTITYCSSIFFYNRKKK